MVELLTATAVVSIMLALISSPVFYAIKNFVIVKNDSVAMMQNQIFLDRLTLDVRESCDVALMDSSIVMVRWTDSTTIGWEITEKGAVRIENSELQKFPVSVTSIKTTLPRKGHLILQGKFEGWGVIQKNMSTRVDRHAK